MLRLIPVLFFLALSAHAADSIQIQLTREPSTLDPMQVNDVYGFGVISNVVEGLLRIDGRGKLENGLAASYKLGNKNLRYEFVIRDTAKWSDGVPVSADDFVFGLRQALSAKVAARDADLLFAIKGAKDYFAGKSESLGVFRKGKNLVIDLDHPDSAFLQVLSMPLAAPVRKDIWEKNKGVWNFSDPVTGRYRITSYKLDRKIELEPNPFNNSPGQLPITYKVVAEEATALNLFETGNLDIISSIPKTEIKRLREKNLIQSSPGAATYFLTFDITQTPFRDLNWRKAFAAAIDRKSLAAVMGDTFTPTSSYIPLAIDGYKFFGNTDFMAALNKVKQSGVKPAVKILFGSSANGNLVMQKLQADFSKNLGLKVSLEPMEWKAFLGRLAANSTQVFLMGLTAPYNDPMSHLKRFKSDEADNHSHYQNPAYDELVQKIVETPVGTARTKLIQKAHELIVAKDAVVVPLLEAQQIFGVGPSIAGFMVNPFTVIQLDRLRKTK
ncbi:MAG: peptide ABC transporter substrate-binding protein [Bacteriovoracia bacterium]